jgi:hypothetical protein
MDGVQNLKSRLGSDMFTIIVLELKEWLSWLQTTIPASNKSFTCKEVITNWEHNSLQETAEVYTIASSKSNSTIGDLNTSLHGIMISTLIAPTSTCGIHNIITFNFVESVKTILSELFSEKSVCLKDGEKWSNNYFILPNKFFSTVIYFTTKNKH